MISYGVSDIPRTPVKAIDITKFLKKSFARRALTELGESDPKLNLKRAQEILSITQEQFSQRWNFDPVQMKPLNNGNYDWVSINQPKNTKCNNETQHTEEESLLSESRLPLNFTPSEFEFSPIQTSSPKVCRKVLDGRLDSYLDYSCDKSNHCLSSLGRKSILICPVPKTPTKSKKTPVKQMSSSKKYPTTPKSRQSRMTG